MINYEKRKKLIGSRIKEEREHLGLTQTELLNRIYKSEKSHKTLTAWETGKRLPDLDSLALMADIFHCDIGYLLGDYNEHTRVSSDIVKETALSEKAVELLVKLALVNKSISGTLSRFITSKGFMDFLLLAHSYRAHAELEKGYREHVEEISRKIDETVYSADISTLSELSYQKKHSEEALQEHFDAKEVLEYRIQKRIFSILEELEVSD